MKTKTSDDSTNSSTGSNANITEPVVAIATTAALTPLQLEEALEERVNSDRRKKTRVLPEAIVDRRASERRNEIH